MKISIAKFQDWQDRCKAIEHEEIKLRIQNLKTKRYCILTAENSDYKLKKIDKEMKRLEKKLLRGRL